MREVILGRTGLKVTNLGLGTGGPSKIGQSNNATDEASIRVVREAVNLGITFFDTAETYRTESHLGRGIADADNLDRLVLSTKLQPTVGGKIKSAADIEKSLDTSLSHLGREQIDVYHVHGVKPELYRDIREQVYPVLVRMKEKGKIHSIGITEHFGSDSNHVMLSEALSDDLWDVIMIGFNVFNSSARKLVTQAKTRNVGVLDMFAVRRAFRSLPETEEYVRTLVEAGKVDGETYARLNPFFRAVDSGECESISELAYRFCFHEPGIDIVLSGTGSISHLRENRLAADFPALTVETLSSLDELFGGIDSVSGN